MKISAIEFIKAQLKAVDVFIAYSRDVKNFIFLYDDSVPTIYMRLFKTLYRVVSQDQALDEKWKKDTMIKMSGLIHRKGTLTFIRKQVRYLKEKKTRRERIR